VSDIFLSYAREDLPRVRPVVDALEARGWTVWWDRTIRPGQIFERVIETALNEARCVVVLWSRDSVQSNWVRKEAAEGERRGILIPALIDDVLIPFAFRDIQAANLDGWQGAQPHAGFQELAQGVEGMLAAPAARRAAAPAAAPAFATDVPRTERVEEPREAAPVAGHGQPLVTVASEGWWNPRLWIVAGALGLFAMGTAVYLIQAPKGGPTAKSLPAGRQPRENPKDGLMYVYIEPGKFMMGCSPGDSECSDWEKPPYEVAMARGFWLGQTPVTQEAYERVVGSNPSNFKGARLPVEEVSWNDAQAYCKAVGMRLPTEAEWEYAARAGSTAARYGNLDQIAWYSGNSGSKKHEVGQKQPNAFGLYDMLGNVWEWVDDDWAAYPGGTIDACAGCKVLRGGSWYDDPGNVRASVRNRSEPSFRSSDIGFRCAGELR
jgi:formylglycine-generating enzyme